MTTTYNAAGSKPWSKADGGTGTTTGVVLKGYHSAANPKWVNARQATLSDYNVCDDTGAQMMSSSGSTTLDIGLNNGSGGILTSPNLAGSIQVNRNMVSGSGTSFTTAFQVGDIINLPDFKQSRKITQINNDTEMLTDSGEAFNYREWQGIGSATTSSTQSKYGTTSLSISGGTGNYAQVFPYEVANGVHSQECTIEFWLYPTSIGSNQTFLGNSSSLDYRIGPNINSGTGLIAHFYSSNGTSWDISNGSAGTVAIAANTWTHYCLMCTGGKLYVFLNGVLDVTYNAPTGLFSEALTHHRLGQNGNASFPNPFTGYFNGHRVSSIPRYSTTSFTPPTTPFTADAFTISLNNFNGTSGSQDFNAGEIATQTPVRWDPTIYGTPTLQTTQKKFGSYSYATGGNSGLGLYTGYRLGNSPANFCLEKWIYSTSTANPQTLFESSTLANTLFVGINTSAKLYWGAGNNGGGSVNLLNATGTTSVSLNTWNHVALSYDGTTYRLFLNGTVELSTASASTPNSSWARFIKIGCGFGNNFPLVGFLDEWRFSKVARYTVNFTAPTSAFTFDSNTISLNHFESSAAGSQFFNTGEVANPQLNYQRGGLARQTHYYTYVIGNGTTSQLALSPRCKSYGETLVDLPSGYTFSRQLRNVITTNIRGLVPSFQVSGNIVYFNVIDDSILAFTGFAGDYMILTGAKATTFSTVTISNFVPKTSKLALVSCSTFNDQSLNYALKVRATGDTSLNGMTVAFCAAGNTNNDGQTNDVIIPLNGQQQFDYKLGNTSAGNITCGFSQRGYLISEV